MNAKVFHVAISGFLLEKTLIFVSELWDLLDEAQRSARGIVPFPLCSLKVFFNKNSKARNSTERNCKKSMRSDTRSTTTSSTMLSNDSPITEIHQNVIDQNEERKIIRRERREAKVAAMIRRKSIDIVKRRGSTGRGREME